MKDTVTSGDEEAEEDVGPRTDGSQMSLRLTCSS